MKSGAKTQSRARRTAMATIPDDPLQLGFWESPRTETPPAPPKRRRAKPSPVAREVARKVGEEILGGDLSPAEWASALADSGTSDGRAVAEYARRRMDTLGEQQIRAGRKELEMEMRKRHFCAHHTSNVRRKKHRREKPSFVGLLLTFMGLWGISAGLLAQTQSLKGSTLLFRSGLSATALCALVCGIYFLSGKSLRKCFAGDRTLGIGSLLCGLSLVLALVTMLPPKPSPSTGQASRAPVPETLVEPRPETPRMTAR